MSGDTRGQPPPQTQLPPQCVSVSVSVSVFRRTLLGYYAECTGIQDN